MKYFDFGLQRSGTNFLEQILNQNFSGRRQNRNNASWKHFIDPPAGWSAQFPTFLIYKNPYTWVESICFRNTVDWIKTQRKYPAQQGPDELKLGPKSINVDALARTYRHWHDKWLNDPDKPELLNQNVFVIKYEDLLNESKRNDILNRIQAKFNPHRNNPNAWNIPTYGKVSQSSDYSRERENYYKEAKPEKLEQKHIDCINELVGVDLIQKLGYEIL